MKTAQMGLKNPLTEGWSDHDYKCTKNKEQPKLKFETKWVKTKV